MNTKQRFDADSILEKISPHIPDEEINFLNLAKVIASRLKQHEGSL